MVEGNFKGRKFVIDSAGALSPKEELEAVAIIHLKSSKQSAKERGVSPETTRKQRLSARLKTNASNQCDFVLMLLTNNWLRFLCLVASVSATVGASGISPNHIAEPSVGYRINRRRAAVAPRRDLLALPAPRQRRAELSPEVLTGIDTPSEGIRIERYQRKLRNFHGARN